WAEKKKHQERPYRDSARDEDSALSHRQRRKWTAVLDERQSADGCGDERDEPPGQRIRDMHATSGRIIEVSLRPTPGSRHLHASGSQAAPGRPRPPPVGLWPPSRSAFS